MHEVSIVEGLIDLVEKEKEKHRFSRVLEIQIVCGIYNCVSQENLEFCLKTVAKGTYLETAIIKVIRLPERWSCKLCHHEFSKNVKEDDPRCPKCGSPGVVPLLNSEMYLNKLEVE